MSSVPLTAPDMEELRQYLCGSFPDQSCLNCEAHALVTTKNLEGGSISNTRALVGAEVALCCNPSCKQRTASIDGLRVSFEDVRRDFPSVVFVVGKPYKWVNRPLNLTARQRARAEALLCI